MTRNEQQMATGQTQTVGRTLYQLSYWGTGISPVSNLENSVNCLRVTYWWNPFLAEQWLKSPRMRGYEFQFVYSFLYVVYGSGSDYSGVNVNQDEKQLWDLSDLSLICHHFMPFQKPRLYFSTPVTLPSFDWIKVFTVFVWLWHEIHWIGIQSPRY